MPTAFPPDGAVTLGDVIERLKALPDPTHKHAEMRSALVQTARMLGKEAAAVPASPAELSQVLADANPATIGMTRQRYTKVRSLVRRALQEVGFDVLAGRDTRGLSAEWQELYRRLPTQALRCGLSRLLSFLSRRSIFPDNMEVDDLALYESALLTGLEQQPHVAFNMAARLWNEARQLVTGWPDIGAQVRADPRRFTRAWNDFDAAFRSDVGAFLFQKENQDPLDDDWAPSVRTITTEGRRRMLQNLATALVDSGFPLENLTALKVLTEPANAKAALRLLLDRNGGETSPHISNQAQLLCTIARHWVRSPEHDNVLRKFASGLRIQKRGMTDKNRSRLRQFDLESNERALLTLPSRVLTEVTRRGEGSRGESVRLMMALAVEILLTTAMRVGNLVALEVDRHIVRTRRSGKEVIHIAIPGLETKMGVPLEFQLSQDTSAMLNAYMREHRARIFLGSNPYLFPGRGGARRTSETLSGALSRFIRRETGLVMNAHLFRHFAAKLYLTGHPDDIETVRQLLGHTSARTTLRVYADIRNDAAHRRYDETLVARRGSKTLAPVPRSPKKLKGSR